MQLSPYVKELLEKRCGHDLAIAADCEILALDIESRTKTHVGATTLKRLLGFTDDERTPHQSTLNVIASYLGFSSWAELSKTDTEGNSGFNASGDEVRSADLEEGETVVFAYPPGRQVSLLYLGANRYRVTESQNSKLQVGDEVEVLNFILHHPLLITNVWRNDAPLGQFTAGRISGLSSIRVI